MKLSRALRTLTLAACGIVFAGGIGGAAAASNGDAKNRWFSSASKKPNILLFITDDLGLDQLRIYGYGGNSAPPTPNLATLQDVGLTFRNAWTMPACSTARGVLYTGRYPFRTNLQAALGPDDLANSMISPYENSIPRVLSRVGYKTALFGKYHIGLQGNNPYGLDMVHAAGGWDYFNGWLDETGDPSSIDTTAGGVGQTGDYPLGYVPNAKYGGSDSGACYTADGDCTYMSTNDPDDVNPPGRACIASGGILVPTQQACSPGYESNLNFQTLSAHYVSPLVINDGPKVTQVPPTDKRARTFRNVQQTDAAIEWIKTQQRAGRSWFATVSTATVHTPLQPPPVDTLPAVTLDPNDASKPNNNIIIANQMIETADHEFGRLLLETGLGEEVDNRVVPKAKETNTVIIYLNDNGSLGAQVRAPFDPYRAKGTPYQTGVWTPMVVAGPPVKIPGQTTDGMVNVADLYELIGTLGGANVRQGNTRAIDSVPMLPYFENVNRPSIRKYDFNFVGLNLQANGAVNGPCQFPGSGGAPSCSQIPVTKGVCEDNGGTWFGPGASGTWEGIPVQEFTYCCQVQQYLKNQGGTPGTVIPTTGIAVRDVSGYKLVRNILNDYDPDSNSCVYNATYNELYQINGNVPDPKLDYSFLQIKTPFNPLQQAKFNELNAYMNKVLASKPECLSKGDGNDDGVVNRDDLENYKKMVRLTSNSSWYDVNLDGYTNSADQQIIIKNLGTRCTK